MMGSLPSGARRAVPALLVALMFLPGAAPVVALTADPPASDGAAQGVLSGGGHRRWLFALIGAAVAVIPAATASDEKPEGTCSSKACITGLAATMGGVVGFLIGREKDLVAARRAAVGPELAFETRSVKLELTPEGLAPYADGAVVVGRDGLAAVESDGAVLERGAGMRGITSASAFPAHDALLAATPTGLFAFPLGGAGEDGQLLAEGDAAVLHALAGDQVAVGGGDVLRRLRLTGRGPALSAVEEARAAGGGIFTALSGSLGTGVVWTLSTDRLVARSAQGLEELGSVTLPAPGRSLALDGDRALVAAGLAGLFLLDVSSPQAPRLVGRIEGIRFAFDGELRGDEAYVAAGNLGLLVVNVADPANPQVVGAARDLGFVNEVALGPDGRVFVTDRQGRRLFIVEPQTRSAGSN